MLHQQCLSKLLHASQTVLKDGVFGTCSEVPVNWAAMSEVRRGWVFRHRSCAQITASSMAECLVFFLLSGMTVGGTKMQSCTSCSSRQMHIFLASAGLVIPGSSCGRGMSKKASHPAGAVTIFRNVRASASHVEHLCIAGPNQFRLDCCLQCDPRGGRLPCAVARLERWGMKVQHHLRCLVHNNADFAPLYELWGAGNDQQLEFVMGIDLTETGHFMGSRSA